MSFSPSSRESIPENSEKKQKTEKTDCLDAPQPQFLPETMESLFFLARDQVAATVAQTSKPNFEEKLGELANLPVLGTFVSVKKHGRLRSCMGYMSEGVPLGRALKASAISAAREDPRFPPINPREFYDLDLEVWVLNGMRKIEAKGDSRVDAIQIGRDGIQIEGRGRRGLLLPSVALEFNWDARRFLDGVCDKAGLSRDAWRSDDVQLFAFEGVSLKKPFVYLVSRNPELATLVADENALRDAGSSAREERPTFSLASGFFNFQAPPTSGKSVGNNAAVPDASASSASETIRPAAVAGTFYPRSKAEQDAAIDDFLKKTTNDNKNNQNSGKIRAAAVLVPHAGWVYSGRIATKTLNCVEIPETVVVLAPKHRAEGANFAVMPRGFWAFGDGQKLENNLKFVNKFCADFQEFKKDDVAHRNEHSIEVQLPILARLSPKTKVVGLLIGRSTATELTAFAERFAKFLSNWEASGETKPLLLISSDMNHYASDARTREIDAKALAALETLEPTRLFETVYREGITMCGVLPAFLATSTLKFNENFNEAIRIEYGTSGDAFGDRERVVGYAGYAFR